MSVQPGAVAAVCTVLVALAGFWQARQKRRIETLERKLRRALSDCLALYDSEKRLCERLAVELDTSALAVKRDTRRALRLSGLRSPSEYATPKLMEEELREL